MVYTGGGWGKALDVVPQMLSLLLFLRRSQDVFIALELTKQARWPASESHGSPCQNLQAYSQVNSP